MAWAPATFPILCGLWGTAQWRNSASVQINLSKCLQCSLVTNFFYSKFVPIIILCQWWHLYPRENKEAARYWPRRRCPPVSGSWTKSERREVSLPSARTNFLWANAYIRVCSFRSAENIGFSCNYQVSSRGAISSWNYQLFRLVSTKPCWPCTATVWTNSE